MRRGLGVPSLMRDVGRQGGVIYEFLKTSDQVSAWREALVPAGNTRDRSLGITGRGDRSRIRLPGGAGSRSGLYPTCALQAE
jgi:hypothetical protein